MREERDATAELLSTTWLKPKTCNVEVSINCCCKNTQRYQYSREVLYQCCFHALTSGEKIKLLKVEPALLTNEATTPLLICSKVLFLIVKLCSLVALLKAQSRCFSLLSSWRLMACQSTVIRVQSAGSLDNCKRRRHVEPRASRDRGVSSLMMQSHTYKCSLWSIVLKFVDIAKGQRPKG